MVRIMELKTQYLQNIHFVSLRGLTALLLVVMSATLCLPGAGNAASRTIGDKEYVIGPGDQLQIMVWKEKDLSQNMAVRIDGRISLPLIGDVVAAGKTIEDLTKDLEKRFSEVVTDPAVSVMLIQSKSWRYYIIGKIKLPGEYPIDFPITVLQAIAKSGGFLEWAKSDNISILRKKGDRETIIKFDYDTLAKGQNLAQNIQIKPGDTIIVP